MKKKFISVLLTTLLICGTVTGLVFGSAGIESFTDENNVQEQEPRSYFIQTVSENGNISFPAGKESYTEGEQVTFSIVPSEGYAVSCVLASDDTGPVAVSEAAGQYTFFMPPANVSIYISYIEAPVETPTEEELPEPEEEAPALEDTPDASGDSADDSEDIAGDSGDSADDSEDTADDSGALEENAETPADGTDDFFTGNPEEDFAVFTSGEAGELEWEDDSDKELLNAMADGEIIGFAPVALDAAINTPVVARMTAEEGTPAVMAALAPGKYEIATGASLYCDEIWTKENHDSGKRLATTNRIIRYIDSAGVERTSPLYCMNASKDGLTGVTDVKDEAIKAIQSSTLRKLLYYGYGGPGDICDDYDPTCSHIDWAKRDNRYFFTHMAISKAYSNDVGKATAAEVAHVGIDRFTETIKAKPLPSRTEVKLQAPDASNQPVTANPCDTNLIFYRTKPVGVNYLWEQFQNGYQISPLVTVADEGKADNGLHISRKSDEIWQLLYWKDWEDYKARGENKPRVMAESGTLRLANGGKFKVVFPKNMTAKQTLTFTMALVPVSYLWVDGSVQEGMDIQDFSTFVYQDAAKKVTLNVLASPRGSLALSKRGSDTGKPVSGAAYTLYAAENIYSGAVLMYKTNAAVETKSTDSSGKITFADLIPGKYYVKETAAAAGYLLDSSAYPVTTGNGTSTLKVTDAPDLRGSLTIHKKDALTQEPLGGAEFMLYAWEESTKAYGTKGTVIPYNDSEKCYETAALVYSEANKGKFKIVETQNPDGYTGAWEQEVVLSRANQEFVFQVNNEPLRLPCGEITLVKKIKVGDVTWAHGNPTFRFAVEGKDVRGNAHKYEDALVFTEENCAAQEDGYASLSLTIRNIPIGEYRIYEKKTLRYYLTDVQPLTSNVSIIRLNEPAYGQPPENTAYAEAALDPENRTAAAAFVNEKKRYDDYSHSDFIKNTVTVP